MAYNRLAKLRRDRAYIRRRGGMKKYVRSQQRSRYTVKTRRYTRKRPMSKRRVMDVTSIKKRDTLLPWSNVTSASQVGGTTYLANPAIITGGSSTPGLLLWCATARDNTQNASGPVGNRFTQSTRTATTCYMKGLSEKIEIQVSDGLPWQWRRICFTVKGIDFGTSTSFTPAIENSNGWARVLNMPSTTTRGILETLLFRGAVNVDWTDPLTAPTDNNRVTVKYDRTITLASGNDDGMIRKYPRYHAMNKNLVYDDDEIGGGKGAATYSARGKAGMGDFYVIDYFRPRTGSTSSNQLIFAPQSTLYWHEK